MSPLESILFVFALVGIVLLLDFLAALLVRAEERWKQAEHAERRAARRTGDRSAGEGR